MLRPLIVSLLSTRLVRETAMAQSKFLFLEAPPIILIFGLKMETHFLKTQLVWKICARQAMVHSSILMLWMLIIARLSIGLFLHLRLSIILILFSRTSVLVNLV